MRSPRRALLLAATTASWLAAEPTVIPLWPDGIPGAGPATAPERYENDHYYGVQSPSLTYFPAPAAAAARSAVVVCPGGGYRTLSWVKEGVRVAEWLNAIGVSAFVLKYRLVEHGQPAPLQDVLRAVRLVRSRAAEFGLDPQRLGVLGFSAGGHLAACAGTMYDNPAGRTGSELDAVSARPDFLVLAYPVIFLEGPLAHAGSREALLGTGAGAELLAAWSPARHVTPATPPTFLFHTGEDKSVPVGNSLGFYQALRAAGVAAELHVFEQGAHGVGLHADLGPTSGWPQRCEEWMRSQGWLPP